MSGLFRHSFFSRAACMFGVIHVMTSLSACSTTCVFTLLSPLFNICKKQTAKKKQYCEHNTVQIHFLSCSTSPPNSVSNFIEHGFSSVYSSRTKVPDVLWQLAPLNTTHLLTSGRATVHPESVCWLTCKPLATTQKNENK